jgi:hypothetical protein
MMQDIICKFGAYFLERTKKDTPFISEPKNPHLRFTPDNKIQVLELFSQGAHTSLTAHLNRYLPSIPGLEKADEQGYVGYSGKKSIPLTKEYVNYLGDPNMSIQLIQFGKILEEKISHSFQTSSQILTALAAMHMLWPETNFQEAVTTLTKAYGDNMQLVLNGISGKLHGLFYKNSPAGLNSAYLKGWNCLDTKQRCPSAQEPSEECKKWLTERNADTRAFVEPYSERFLEEFKKVFEWYQTQNPEQKSNISSESRRFLEGKFLD